MLFSILILPIKKYMENRKNVFLKNIILFVRWNTSVHLFI